MSLLDLIALQRILHNGVELFRRKRINFVGGTVTDDPALDAVHVELGSGSEGTVNGPVSSVTGHLATWLGTDGTEIDDSGVLLAQLATTANLAALAEKLDPCVYRGGLGGTAPAVSYSVSNVWTGLISAISGGAWADDVSANIARSGESFTVAKAGWYHVDLAAPAYIATTPPLWGLRCRVNGAVKLSQVSYGGNVTNAGNNGYLSGVVLCAAGDVISFQYCAANGTPSFGLSSGQVGGANPNVISVSIVRVIGT